MLEILKKLRAHSPEWYAKYVQAYEHEFAIQYNALLQAPTDKVLRQQGIVSAMDSHLAILKSAL